MQISCEEIFSNNNDKCLTRERAHFNGDYPDKSALDDKNFLAEQFK